MKKLFWIDDDPQPRLAIVLKPQSSGAILETLTEYRQAGIETLVSLLEEKEASMLGLAKEAHLAKEAGMRFLNYPIADMSVPEDLAAFRDFVANLAERMRNEERIGVHCRASIGRSTIVAACALIHLGWKPFEAIRAIEKARGLLVPETQEQEDWILLYKSEPD